jgi:transposase
MDGVRVQGRRGPPRRRPRVLVGDKGYSYRPVRAWARAHHVKCCLPERKDQGAYNRRRRAPFDRALYRERNLVERAVGRLKEFRAVATRYDKLALNYRATVQVAVLLLHLRRLYPSDRA